MKVAIHQPNFMPWLGFFHKMVTVDHFVFLDDVPFSKGSYTNRVQIKTVNGPQWLTVPVQTSGKLAQPIEEVWLVESRWSTKIVKTLKQCYGKSPFYDEHKRKINALLWSSAGRLADMNLALIHYLTYQLDIDVTVSRSSWLSVEGSATERLIAICLHLEADTYVSGFGGADYQEVELFEAAGIKVEYDDFVHPVYEQRYGEFVKGLSAIDLLFNCGLESGSILKKELGNG